MDGTARIWDAVTGYETMRFTGHTNAPVLANFSPDGAQIVTASLDKTARVWDVDSGNELLLLSGQTDRLMSAGYSPDGQRVLTASFDGSAWVWNARTIPIPTQITWARAAEFDPLSRTERSQLGFRARSDLS
jgi:WD40 repeat protein